MTSRNPLSRVTIGSVSRNIYECVNPGKVPKGYLSEVMALDEEQAMQHLRWMLTKVRVEEGVIGGDWG